MRVAQISFAAATLSILCASAHGRTQEALPAHPSEVLVPSLPPYAPTLPQSIDTESDVRLLLLRSTSPLVRTVIRYPGGRSHDPAGSVGTSRVLAEAMRAGGTAQYPAGKLDTWLRDHAAELSIESRLDAFELRFACPPQAWEEMSAIVASMLTRPRLADEDIEGARRRVAARERARRASPSFLADWALAVVAYGPDAPSARRPSATSLRGIDRGGLTSYHDGTILAGAPTLGIEGAIDAGRAQALAKALVPDNTDNASHITDRGADREPSESQAPEGARAAERATFAGFIQPARTRVWIVDRPGSTHAEVRLAAPGIRRLDPDASQLELWSRFVGTGGRAQRLGDHFPERDVTAGFRTNWGRTGTFFGSFRAPADKVARKLGGLLRILEEAKRAPSPETLDRLRRRLMNEEVAASDEPREALARVLDLVFYGYPEDFYRRRTLSWRNADPEGIAAAVEARLDLGRLAVVVVGPMESLSKSLAGFGDVESLSLEQALSPGADQPDVVEAMFEALGGRENWAEAAAVQAEIDIVMSDREIPSRQWSDLNGPRFRAEYLIAGESVVLVMDAASATQATSQGRVRLDDARHAEQLAVQRKTLWVILHRMALDAGVRVRLDEERNLTVRDDAGLDVRIELGEDHLPRRVTDESADPPIVRELLDWSSGGALSFPQRILIPAQSLEWRIHSLTTLEEFAPLLLEAGD